MSDLEDIVIANEFIQQEAECCIHRRLTEEEYEEIYWILLDGLSDFIYYNIYELMGDSKTIEENKDADKISLIENGK